MRSLAFVVTMLFACAGKSTHVQQPRQDCENGGCAAKQDCGNTSCEGQGTATEPVQALMCDTPPCVNELSRRFNAPNPCGDPKPCDNDPSCGGVKAEKPCDSDPNCGGVKATPKPCDDEPCR